MFRRKMFFGLLGLAVLIVLAFAVGCQGGNPFTAQNTPTVGAKSEEVDITIYNQDRKSVV